MKRIMIALLAFASGTAVFAQKKVADVAKFNSETYDFGKIKQSVPATATFTVTNVGTTQLIIEQANPTCGCTISDYTKSPIAPGQTGSIKATFNAAALGPIHKSLTVKFAGIEEIKMINLTGEVVGAPATAQASATNNAATVVNKVKVDANGETKVKSTNADGSKTTEKTKNHKMKKKTVPAAAATS